MGDRERPADVGAGPRTEAGRGKDGHKGSGRWSDGDVLGRGPAKNAEIGREMDTDSPGVGGAAGRTGQRSGGLSSIEDGALTRFQISTDAYERSRRGSPIAVSTQSHNRSRGGAAIPVPALVIPSSGASRRGSLLRAHDAEDKPVSPSPAGVDKRQRRLPSGAASDREDDSSPRTGANRVISRAVCVFRTPGATQRQAWR